MENSVKNYTQGLVDTYEAMYQLYYPEVERIINNKITDISLIENTLNKISSIYNEKGFYLFLKLLFYLSDIDMERSYSYLDYLRLNRKEEYDNYVKKIGEKRQ